MYNSQDSPEQTNIAKQIIHEKGATVQGEAIFSMQENRRKIIIEVNWKKKYLNLKINIDKPYPGSDFVPCKINISKFLSAVMRYSNFNFYGTASTYSEYLLSSEVASKLMTQRNASIELFERSFDYKCRIKNCPAERLEILISLSKKLSEEMDVL